MTNTFEIYEWPITEDYEKWYLVETIKELNVGSYDEAINRANDIFDNTDSIGVKIVQNGITIYLLRVPPFRNNGRLI